jgi:predicted nucleic acid-binding protein
MINKPKVYLDTSVISHLFQDEKPDEKEYTLEFWGKIKQGEFEVFISQVVDNEIRKAPAEKAEKMIAAISEIDHNEINLTDEIRSIAAELIKNGILPPKSVPDSLHIAAALVGGCDYLATWNMKHLANIKTNQGVRVISAINNYKELHIDPPVMFLGGYYDTKTENQ